MSFFVGAILPFLTVALFVGGMAYRIRAWRKLPVPAMTLFPTPRSTGKRLLAVLKETFLLERLFRGDRNLWLLGGLFHGMLAVTLLAHYGKLLALAGLTRRAVLQVPLLSGGPAGIALMGCAVLLLLRRLIVRRVATISRTGDYVALLLVLAVVATGDALRYLHHVDVVRMRDYFSGLATFSYRGLPENPWFVVHFLLAQALVIYIPFSKGIHVSGVFFTQAAVHRH